MNLHFQPTVHADAAAISELLGRVFQLPAGAPLLDEKCMRWKYWTARSDWEGSRSYTARHNGALAAHAAVWPVRVRVSGQELTAVKVIDWAADPRYPGAGAWLIRRIAARVRIMVGTGGSKISGQLLPLIGFRPHGELCHFGRSVRPLEQALTTAPRDWKLPARLVRNGLWALSHPLSAPDGWSVTPLTPEEVPEVLWARSSSNRAVTTRDASFYRYVMSCPVAPHALFGLQKSGNLTGYFCVALVPHVARIADLWLRSTNVEDWRDGFRTAATHAASDKHVYEISAWGSTALAKEALSRAGFLLRERSAVSLFGDAKVLDGRELQLQMLDSDASFLASGAASYLT